MCIGFLGVFEELSFKDDLNIFNTSLQNGSCFGELQAGSGASSLGLIQLFASWPKSNLLGRADVWERIASWDLTNPQVEWGANQRYCSLVKKYWEGVLQMKSQRFFYTDLL